MKKIISANIEKELADKLDMMSKQSFPHVSKSAIVEYALEKIDVENFTQEETENGMVAKKKSAAKKKPAAKKEKK